MPEHPVILEYKDDNYSNYLPLTYNYTYLQNYDGVDCYGHFTDGYDDSLFGFREDGILCGGPIILIIVSECFYAFIMCINIIGYRNLIAIK